MARATGWWDDPAELQRRLGQHDGSWEKLSRATGVPASTLKSAAARHHRAGVVDSGDGDATLTSRVGDVRDVESLMRSYGLNPADWVANPVVVNEWGDPEKPSRQLKAHLRRKVDGSLLAPAHEVQPFSAPRKPDKTKSRLVVFVGDEQQPHGDPWLEECFLRWLDHNKPAEGVHLGDLLDLGPLSRHRPDPKWDFTVQDGVNAGYRTLRYRREASPETAWVMLPSNHGERLRDFQLAHAAALYGVRPADIDEQQFAPALSERGLLHLDALGIRYLGDDGDYEHIQHDVAPELVTRHGWITGANAAEKTLRKLGVSCVVGHTHDQRITYMRQWRGRNSVVLQAVEAGTMCKVNGGLGYTINPEWSQGFATAVVDPDGGFVLELATYQDGVLRWRDQKYTAKRPIAVAA